MTHTVPDTQCDALERHLKAGLEIDPMTALRRYGIFRLASRICDLQARGLVIDRRLDRTADGKRYAVYRLSKPQKKSAVTKQKKAA